jgi:hypothetical protein
MRELTFEIGFFSLACLVLGFALTKINSQIPNALHRVGWFLIAVSLLVMLMTGALLIVE